MDCGLAVYATVGIWMEEFSKAWCKTGRCDC